MSNTFEVKEIKEGKSKGMLSVSLELTESDAFVKLPKNLELVVNKDDLVKALGLDKMEAPSEDSASKKSSSKKQDK